MSQYQIIGKHNFYPGLRDVYWEGDELKEGLIYLNQLRTTTALCNIEFEIKESEVI